MPRLIGTDLVTKSYYDRIREFLDGLHQVSADVLPHNRAYIHKLLGEGAFFACDCLLSGIHEAVSRIDLNQKILDRFQGFQTAEETKLRNALINVRYELDAPNTLDLLIGSGRLDTVRHNPYGLESSLIYQSHL